MGRHVTDVQLPDDASFYGSPYGSGEPTNNFQVLNATQQIAARAALQMYSDVANLTFTEVTETASTHGDIRYGQSGAPSTSWAYYPCTSQVGGDVWIGDNNSWYTNPVKGTYAWATFIHETGHAMGLKHPHEASGAFAAMPADHDSLEYSIMSYHSYVGSGLGGYTNGSTSYPQTLMMYDIAALQVEYGANYTTHSGSNVYTWDPNTGQEFIDGVGQGAPAGNKIFMTIWDGGGNDTYDFHNYATNLTVDLSPGGWTTTSTTQLANLGNGHNAVGNIANALLYQGNTASLIENAIGGTGNDTITGNSADNHLTGGAGNDVLDGGTGNDTAIYTGTLADYSQVDNGDGTWTIADLRSGTPDGTDTLTSIEYLQFSDQTVTIGTVTPPPPPPPPPPPTNTAPVAVDDTYAVDKGGTLVIDASKGVLANDTDADGQALTAILVSSAGNGSFTLNADGSLEYKARKEIRWDGHFLLPVE